MGFRNFHPTGALKLFKLFKLFVWEIVAKVNDLQFYFERD